MQLIRSIQRHETLVKTWRLLHSCVVSVLLRLNADHVRRLLLHGVIGVSIYGVFAFMLGGMYRYPWELVGVVMRLNYVTVRTVAGYVARGCKPLYPEWTLAFELLRAWMRCIMSVYGDRLVLPKNAQFLRWQSDWIGTREGRDACRLHGTTMETFEHNNLEHIWVRGRVLNPSKTTRPRRLVVLYFHGGGFAVLSPRMYVRYANEILAKINDKLAREHVHSPVQVDFLMGNYRKIPEHPYPIPPQDAYCVYEYLIHHEKLDPSQIIVAGDSAGGALAITTLLRIRDRHMEPPLAGLVSCPFVDMTVKGNELETPHCIIGDKAIHAVIKSYHSFEGDPATWGDVSPVHCNLRGLPPVYIQAAELDYILPHSLNLYAKAKADGLDHWVLDVHKNLPHVYTTTPSWILPAVHQGFDALATFAAGRFAESMRNAPCA
ncbi:hypothetical protein Poli38472_004439 [Pythium oligandrum]|uniref:Alpha/beta hydrolase fold-3 domain-containing protein n=1 Tax=Pythium oligandrum TaxID=41045 RepID=A0A8K1FDF6_PYTOL|nr:hypothetical protein Poli38472_004439 [Pythium oligandrum]|eukprot:TMW59370.1 hypothetical protein Poli38472_004439 [Pythium oligandrum]